MSAVLPSKSQAQAFSDHSVWRKCCQVIARTPGATACVRFSTFGRSCTRKRSTAVPFGRFHSRAPASRWRGVAIEGVTVRIALHSTNAREPPHGFPDLSFEYLLDVSHE